MWWRPFCWRDDEEANGQIYNLGSDEVINLRELAALLVEANGGGEFQMCKFPSDRKRIDIGDYYADYQRIRSELGWTPRVNLQEGLARTMDLLPTPSGALLMIENQLVAVPQADPKAGYLAHQAEIDTAVHRVLESGRYILGREVESFEQAFSAYIGVRHSMGVGSGTDALELALRACGVGQGDLVFTVSHTAVATVAAIEVDLVQCLCWWTSIRSPIPWIQTAWREH